MKIACTTLPNSSSGLSSNRPCTTQPTPCVTTTPPKAWVPLQERESGNHKSNSAGSTISLVSIRYSYIVYYLQTSVYHTSVQSEIGNMLQVEYYCHDLNHKDRCTSFQRESRMLGTLECWQQAQGGN